MGEARSEPAKVAWDENRKLGRAGVPGFTTVWKIQWGSTEVVGTGARVAGAESGRAWAMRSHRPQGWLPSKVLRRPSFRPASWE